jgi:hypothetical protein
MATFKDKISNLIGSQVPDFVLDDHPKFLQFLKTYYSFLEAAELKVTSIQTTDGIQLETETGQDNKLLLNGSRIDSDITLLDEGDKILLESSFFGKFTRGEIVQGQTSKATSTVLAEDLNNDRLFIVAQDKFVIGETVLGLSSNASAVINNYRPNPVNNIQELLNFRDPDKAISNFLTQFRDEFLSTLPENLNASVNKRNLIKNVKSLYQSKGTADGNKIFFRLLFDENAETIYPREQILRVSDGKFTTNKILRVINPIGNTLNLVSRTITGITSNTTAIVENATEFLIGSSIVTEFTLNQDSILGTFIVGEDIRGTANDDDDNLIKATISGIPVSKIITNDGALHSVAEQTTITGGGDGAIIQTQSIGSGAITEIIIDSPGSNYNIGDELIFTNTNTNGGGAAGFISVVNGGFTLEESNSTTEDHIIMEDATTDGDTYFGNKFIQDSGGDLGEIRGDITDIFLYNGGSGYNSLPTVSVEPSSAGSSAILKTFGEEIGRILDLNLVELGINHQLSPTPPTLNLFKNCIVTNVSGSFSTGNTVTLTGGVTATVVSFNNPRGLLILKDNSGLINVGDTVTGPLGSAVIKKLDSATATLAVGSVADTDGVFINEDGFISENTMRIQDSLLYQDFSYIIKVGRSIADWRDNFKKTIHTSGFYFIGQVEIDSRINARISIPITGAVSGVIDEPFYNVINTLFSKVFGRRLGTVDDGTSLRTNPKLGADVDFLTETISPFSSTTRDVTLVRVPIKIDYLSRVREKFNDVTISTGFVYGGPRYQTINREIFKTFGISGTNYSFEELSKNVTFGTKSAFDGLENTFFFSSTNTGRMLKTKLTMPAFIDIAVPENVFDNTKTTFDQLIDNNSNPITFDDTTP